MPQTTEKPLYAAAYPILAKAQKPGGVTVLSAVTGGDVPNKPVPGTPTIQMAVLGEQLQQEKQSEGVEEDVEEVEPEEVDEEVEEEDENGDPVKRTRRTTRTRTTTRTRHR